MAWIRGIVQKVFPYTEEGKTECVSGAGKAQELPEELFFFSESEIANGQIRLVSIPKDNIQLTIANVDVNNPKQIIAYKKIRTFWVTRQSEVVEVPEPVRSVVEVPKKKKSKR